MGNSVRSETRGVKFENQNNCLNYPSLESYTFEVQIPQKEFPNKLTLPKLWPLLYETLYQYFCTIFNLHNDKTMALVEKESFLNQFHYFGSVEVAFTNFR